ncbi:MAG: bifunctional 23S rRNA (guanine(2069)-N(7))-methyltransferase RlmK/23S rRNA (guanine(2445)-N(2))-methyltransferase RlmL, partial [Myxococcota bacterium]
MDFVVTIQGGAEAHLADELRGIGGMNQVTGRGAVHCEGGLRDLYRTILWSRLASRVGLPLHAGPVRDSDELYAQARDLRWEDHFDVGASFVVEVGGSHPSLLHQRFVVQRIKDAIADRFRDRCGRRPDVNRSQPDIRVYAHLSAEQVTLGLNLSGASLAHRGYRRVLTDAPLRENAAALVLRVAGYRGTEPLVDPMCGSGTFAIEAAWIAGDVAPGLFRAERQPERLGVSRWAGHDPALFEELLEEARARRVAGRQTKPDIIAADRSLDAVMAAKANAGAAEVLSSLRLARRAFEDLVPPSTPGVVVANPPYGERLGEEAELGPLYQRLGNTLRQRYLGYRAFVLTGSRALSKRIGLRAEQSYALRNGPLESRLFEYRISSEAPRKKATPGWQKPGPEAEMFENRLRKNWKKWRRWAARQPTNAFRMYDGDIPEFNLSVDFYAGRVRIEELGRPKAVSDTLAEHRLRDAHAVVGQVLGVDDRSISLRARRRRGKAEQHQRRAEHRTFHQVEEHGLRFLVNLEDYLDTGLFLDD